MSEITGLSHDTIQKILTLDNEEEKGNPLATKLLKDIDEKGKKVNFAYQELNKAKLAKQKPIADPTGKRQLGYMDFAWEFGIQTRISPKYRTMTLEQGKNLNLELTTNSVMFFWTTMSNIEQSQELLNHWGFEIKSEIIWVKTKDEIRLVKTAEDILANPNPGHYIEGVHEKLYICTRGNIGTPIWKPKSVIFAPKSEHSKKPAIFKEIINKMYPHLSKREYFHRGPKPNDGWDYWGDESK